jgi:hypothetical protein
MRIAKSIFVGSLAALVLVAVPALAKPEDGRQTGFGLLPSLPAGPRWITDAIVLRRNGRKGTAEGHRARTTNAVSPTGGVLSCHRRRGASRKLRASSCASRCRLRTLHLNAGPNYRTGTAFATGCHWAWH